MHTLVLNKDFRPIGIMPWQKALGLYFRGKAEIVEEYEDREIRSVSLTIKMPSVVRLVHWIRNKTAGLRFNKANVYYRDKGLCQYCTRSITKAKATYDHVMPKSRGGLTNWNNIVTCCTDCNHRKDCRTPEEAAMALLNKPSRPSNMPVELSFMIAVRHKNNLPNNWKNWIVNLKVSE